MSENINLQLRTEILKYALETEQSINSLLIIYLSIDSEERKAVTNKSGNLSFKNKIDLLFDLEILSKEEHKTFLLLMEFRNQFVHNIDCNSFTKAVLFLGIDKGRSLLKFTDIDSESDKEILYKNAFNNLYWASLKIIMDKIKKRKQIINEKSELLTVFVNSTVFTIEYFFGIFHKFAEKYEPKDSDSPEILELKMKILTEFAKELHKISETKQYKLLAKKMSNSMQPEKLKAYFK
jgi:hypothetical protein